MNKLTPFDASSVCPKCGHDDIDTRYEGPIEDDPCWYDRTYNPVGKWPRKEYMHRTCERCKYQWPEAVIAGRAALSTKEKTGG